MTNQDPPRDKVPIDDDERLFRALRREDVEEGLVLPSAVDTQGTSVSRRMFLDDPREALRFAPSACSGVASLVPREFPPNQPNPSDVSIEWEFFAVDDPFVDEKGVHHIAHAEVRVRRLSDQPSEENVRPKGVVKQILRAELAKVMTVEVEPE